ncbi:MAG TPA: hypothetical protein VFA54_04600 [Bryobacterales bacterium]|jgi:hypothetical protein|nr:hypothetical protein [Bryobacterales bacterium]
MPDAEIQQLIEELHSLRDGEQAVIRLISLGWKAVGPLREFLLQSAPVSVYQPRRWAVEALAALGAKDVLIEYLLREDKVSDPVVRLGEEAVENAAARALAEWQDVEAFLALSMVSERKLLAGVVDGLGRFGRMESIPYLQRALEDDLCREAAEAALRNMGAAARPSLIASALIPRPSMGEESPSSVRRRRSALNILGEMGMGDEDRKALFPLLNDADPEIVIRAATILEPGAAGEQRRQMARRLLEVLPAADWTFREDLESCLQRLFADARLEIEQEIARRMALPAKDRILDFALRVLLRVRSRC